MRIFIIVIIFICLGCGYRYATRKQNRQARNLEKLEKYYPPGTVKITEKLFIDKYEVTVGQWKAFVDSKTKSVTKDDAISLQPDTLVWISYFPNVGVYFRHELFNDHPIVGVSHEQAVKFCKWRTDSINRLLKTVLHNNWDFKQVVYRLPTKAEWEVAASNKLDTAIYPYGFALPYQDIDDNIYYLWPSHVGPYGSGKHAVEVNVLWPNNFGAYNLMGNVSEMIADRGVAKGGNFNWPLDSCKVRLNHHYEKPEAWLGFRCICEVIE